MLDIDISETVEKWIGNVNGNDCLFLIDNSQCSSIKLSEYNLINLSSIDFCEEIEISKENVALYSYLLHPVVRINKALQTEKNQERIARINDRNTTFFLKTV